MRAISLTSMAAAFVLLFGSPLCRAQTAPSDKSASPQSLTGPGGKDTRGESSSDKAAPKEGDSLTKSDPKTHVNTLSPGEKRRAARARERAASKGTPTKKVEETTSTKAVQPPPPTEQATPSAAKQAANPAPPPAAKQKAGKRSAPVADLHRHARPPKNRSAYGGGSKWVPRVGAVVPRDVPLYDVPPGYRPGGYYVARPPWRYMPGPGYPPFPRVGRAYSPFPRDDIDDFDDAN